MCLARASCIEDQGLRPMGNGQILSTRAGSERQSPPLVKVPMFINDCSACAKAIHESFLLEDVYSSRLLSYRDQPTPPCAIPNTVGLLVAIPSGDLPDPRLSLHACHFRGVSLFHSFTVLQPWFQESSFGGNGTK